MRRRLNLVFSLVSFAAAQGCSSNSNNGGSGGTAATSGGATAQGGAPATHGGTSVSLGGGPASGGATSGASGGPTTGGSSAGGSTAGGSTAGGSTAGGSTSSSGGASDSGGEDAGGSDDGGTSNGGSTAGGSTNGGSSAGGKAAGGSSAGGKGGTTGAGGSTSGGATGTGGAGTTLADPCRGTALPAAQHFVPSGLCASMVASGQGTLRQITFTTNGDLWGVTANGQIRRFRDTNNDGAYQAGEITNFASTGGNNGNNVHIDEAGGFLYAGTPAGVKRWPWSATTDSGGAGEDVLTGQPSSGGHNKHTVHVWDGYMYVQSGSSGNVTNPDSPSYDNDRSLIKRFQLSQFQSGTPFVWSSSGQIVTDGLRNTVGFNRDGMGRIFGVQNGQDDVTYGGVDVHADNPGEIIARIDMGLHYGYPFCFHSQRVNAFAPGTALFSAIFLNNPHNDAWCQSTTNVSKPATFVQSHSAPLDIIFYTGTWGNLPDKWRNGAFVAMHGSWNRTPATGYKVVWVPFNLADGTSPMPTNSGTTTTFPYEVVFGRGSLTGGHVDGSWNWSGGENNVRPVGVAVSPVDGALYISSDSQGYVYRVGIKR